MKWCIVYFTGGKLAKKAACVVLSLLALVWTAQAQTEAKVGFGNDGIDRTDPNFVTASLLIMSPGDDLYSCAGHACIRLECPAFNLDYCFSYESESVKDKVLTFFRGQLKMGMFAIPTSDYLRLGCESGRGVRQYRLNLPADAKQRLWEVLDKKVAEGPYLAYDYMERGCAQSALSVVQEALMPYELAISEWPEKYGLKSRHELLEMAIGEAYPWQTFLLYTICGATTDDGMSKLKKVVIPSDLLEILRIAKVGGAPVIVDEGVELLPVSNGAGSPAVITPLLVALIVFVVALVNLFVRRPCLDRAFVAFQALLGFFMTYMVCFSSLTAIGWNWLIVPFNILPVIVWKWRRKWALLFVAVLVLWEVGMIFHPHRLTDPAYLVLVGSYIIFYLKFTILKREVKL